jgi:dTDP-4-amino-4,6-dideoxygalactose transaminase
MPLHLSKIGEEFGYKKGQFPVTEKVSATIVRLPLCSFYDSETVNYICDSVLEFFGIA